MNIQWYHGLHYGYHGAQQSLLHWRSLFWWWLVLCELSINQTSIARANIPGEARLSGATAKSVFNSKIEEKKNYEPASYPAFTYVHINAKELFSVGLAAERWAHKWANTHIVIHRDKTTTTTTWVINKGSSFQQCTILHNPAHFLQACQRPPPRLFCESRQSLLSEYVGTHSSQFFHVPTEAELSATASLYREEAAFKSAAYAETTKKT